MTDLGKVDADFFDRVIAPNLGADRDDVSLGPTAGIDFGVLEVGENALVTATDPLSILPALGLERAGQLAIDIVLSDVAVSGIAPSHLSVSLTLPREFSTDTLGEVWHSMDAHARDLGVSVVATHAGHYLGVASSWFGGATAFGIGDPDDIVRPDRASPGDAIVMSTGPAAELTGLISTLYPEALGLPAETIATAQERVDEIPAVADALAAHDAGQITAMHDASEGGVAGGLVEMATGAGVRFELDSTAVPLAEGVATVCDVIDVDPWHVTSCGSLLITVAPADAAHVVAALEDRGTPAAVVGQVEAGAGVYADDQPIEPPETDPSWEAMSRISNGS